MTSGDSISSLTPDGRPAPMLKFVISPSGDVDRSCGDCASISSSWPSSSSASSSEDSSRSMKFAPSSAVKFEEPDGSTGPSNEGVSERDPEL